MAVTHTPRLSRGDYDAIRRVAHVNGGFPATYALWLERCNAEDARHLAGGSHINPVEITAREFFKWCRHDQARLSVRSLGAFAEAKAHMRDL